MDFIKDLIYGGGDVRLTSPYGMRNHPITGKRVMHWGVDTVKRGDINARLYSPCEGKVLVVLEGGGRGKRIYIDYPKLNCILLIQHLNSYRVKVGDNVKKGQWIANQGSTGTSTGSHLHLEVLARGFKNLAGATRFDPLIVLKKGGTMQYTVKAGDTLSKIGVKFGIPWQELYEYNKNIIGANPGIIRVGTILNVPVKEDKQIEELIKEIEAMQLELIKSRKVIEDIRRLAS